MLSRVNWVMDTLAAVVAALLMVEFDHGEFGMRKGCLSQIRCFQMFSWKRNGELDLMNPGSWSSQDSFLEVGYLDF